jgi:hypothetical protein
VWRHTRGVLFIVRSEPLDERLRNGLETRLFPLWHVRCMAGLGCFISFLMMTRYYSTLTLTSEFRGAVSRWGTACDCELFEDWEGAARICAIQV